jgi:hypothetical protein
VAPGVDLTQPADPEWGDHAWADKPWTDEKYGGGSCLSSES